MNVDAEKTVITLTEFGSNLLVKREKYYEGKLVYNNKEVIKDCCAQDFIRNVNDFIKEKNNS